MATDVLMSTDSGARKKWSQKFSGSHGQPGQAMAGHGGPWLAKVLGHQFYQLGARVEVNVGGRGGGRAAGRLGPDFSPTVLYPLLSGALTCTPAFPPNFGCPRWAPHHPGDPPIFCSIVASLIMGICYFNLFLVFLEEK